MRHKPAPGTLWFTGREDECAVSEALPIARCCSCPPACREPAQRHWQWRAPVIPRHTLLPGQAAQQRVLQHHLKPIFTAQAAFSQPLCCLALQGCSLCWENRILPRWALLQHVMLTFPFGCESTSVCRAGVVTLAVSKIPATSLASPCVPVVTELCNQVFTWKSRGLSLVAG